MKKIKSSIVGMVVTTLLLAAPCWGAPFLVLTGRGNGLFEVMGKGLENVGGIDLTVSYNPATLTDPRVSQRGLTYGAMMTPNLSVPGTVRVGIVKPQGITGTGSMIMLSFSPMTRGQGEITSFTAHLVSTKAADIPVQTQVLVNDSGSITGDPFAGGLVSPPTDPITGTSGGGTPVTLGVVTYPDMPTPGSVGVPAPPPETAIPVPTTLVPPVPEPVTEVDRPGGPPEALNTTGGRPEKGVVSQPQPQPGAVGVAPNPADVGKSILELFRNYVGPVAPQWLIQLFSRPERSGFHQEPAILLADGTTRGTVTLDIPLSGERSPNFALNGARLVSLKIDGSRYLLEIMPDTKVVDASLMVLNNGVFTEYPLTVAPAMDIKSVPTGKNAEGAFALYLRGIGEGRGDLNGDGRADYVDEYIYTANYLVRNGKPAPGGAGGGIPPAVSVAPVIAPPVVALPVDDVPKTAVAPQPVIPTVSTPVTPAPPAAKK